MSGGKAPSAAYQAIHAVVRRIPPGSVASYGQVARLAGLTNAARQVGYALHALPTGTTVPWHRVVNARGAISLRDHQALTQRMLLMREEIRFDARGRVDLARQGWQPGQTRPDRKRKPA